MLHSLRANDPRATLISSVTKVIVWSARHKPGTCVESATGVFLTLIRISYYLHQLSINRNAKVGLSLSLLIDHDHVYIPCTYKRPIDDKRHNVIKVSLLLFSVAKLLLHHVFSDMAESVVVSTLNWDRGKIFCFFTCIFILLTCSAITQMVLSYQVICFTLMWLLP